ncbi:MAG: polyphenol oxidase family protein, partial [Sporichthyaceae bacterium]|nr:polyphenol oxidase family protein [Sporichthyaceae bacterium]
VVGAAVAALNEQGVEPHELVALVGPAVCGRCYEVPEAMVELLATALPAARSTTRSGTPALDLPAAVAAQLTAAGVTDVEVDPTCTVESENLYSHRRDGVTGRVAGVVWLAA